MAVHVIGGTVGLFAGAVAVSVAKGRRTHRVAGTIFLAAMLVMAVFADVLAVVTPGQIPNLFVGSLSAYLVVTGWLAIRPPSVKGAMVEKAAFGIILCLCVPFVVICAELALGAPLFFKSAIPIRGPVAIALTVFTGIVLLAAALDARNLWGKPLLGRARLGRHLWRMTLGLAFAAGSAFTNGLPRLLPKSLHIPLGLFFLPQLLVLALLLFWMVRIRFPPWTRTKPNASVKLPA